MARKSQQDWLAMSLEVLAESGPAALTVDGLAARLEVTKGSFYHHFKNQQDFTLRLLEYWEYEITERVIAFAEAEQDAAKVLDRIIEAVASYPVDPEPAIRMWAREDDAVRAILQRVDERRLTYAIDLFTRHTGDPERARLMGQMLYAILIGADFMLPPPSKQELFRMHHEFKRLYDLD